MQETHGRITINGKKNLVWERERDHDYDDYAADADDDDDDEDIVFLVLKVDKL